MMNKKVTFYIVSDSFLGEFGSTLELHEQVALKQLVQLFTQKKKIYLHCDSQLQAEKFDECLWQFPVDRFIPHALKGEGEKSFAPVQIGWGGVNNANNADININLQQTEPLVLLQCAQIIDFVPAEDALKKLARERYRFYTQHGFALQTLTFQS